MVAVSVKAAGPKPPVGLDIIPDGLSVSDEMDVMVSLIRSLSPDRPDVVMSTCMALMARCTELHLKLWRQETKDRKARPLRTMELQKVIELLEFTYKAASRLVEFRRQDADLSR